MGYGAESEKKMKETKKKGRAKKRRWSPGTRRVLRSGRATCRTFVSICARGTVLTLACPPLVVCNSVSWRQCAVISLFFFSVRTAYLGGLGVKKKKNVAAMSGTFRRFASPNGWW